jgi:hypothetical protein
VIVAGAKVGIEQCSFEANAQNVRKEYLRCETGGVKSMKKHWQNGLRLAMVICH